MEVIVFVIGAAVVALFVVPTVRLGRALLGIAPTAPVRPLGELHGAPPSERSFEEKLEDLGTPNVKN